MPGWCSLVSPLHVPPLTCPVVLLLQLGVFITNNTVLNHFPNLTHLTLASTCLGVWGGIALAPALQAITRLQHLNLGDNSIGTVGAIVLACPKSPH